MSQWLWCSRALFLRILLPFRMFLQHRLCFGMLLPRRFCEPDRHLYWSLTERLLAPRPRLFSSRGCSVPAPCRRFSALLVTRGPPDLWLRSGGRDEKTGERVVLHRGTFPNYPLLKVQPQRQSEVGIVEIVETGWAWGQWYEEDPTTHFKGFGPDKAEVWTNLALKEKLAPSTLINTLNWGVYSANILTLLCSQYVAILCKCVYCWMDSFLCYYFPQLLFSHFKCE